MKLLHKGLSLALIIRQIPLFVLAMWSVIPGSAPDSPDQLLRVGLTYKFRSYSRRLRRSPGHIAGAFFCRSTRRGSIRATSAHLKLPDFDHPRRELALPSAGAPAGLGPHVKQALIAGENFRLGTPPG